MNFCAFFRQYTSYIVERYVRPYVVLFGVKVLRRGGRTNLASNKNKLPDPFSSRVIIMMIIIIISAKSFSLRKFAPWTRGRDKDPRRFSFFPYLFVRLLVVGIVTTKGTTVANFDNTIKPKIRSTDILFFFFFTLYRAFVNPRCGYFLNEFMQS